MMRQEQILRLYDQEQRRDAPFANVRREVTAHVVRYVGLQADQSYVLSSFDLNAANIEQVVREQIAYFEEIGHSFEWKVYDYDKPSDLRERLKAMGFEVDEPEAVMALDLQNVPAQLLEPPAVPARRITNPEDLAAVRAVEEAVWNRDFTDLIERLAADLQRDPEHLSVYVIDVDGQPVGSAWTYFFEGSHFANMFGGSTLPAYRNRGLYTALLAVRVQEAAARGVRFLEVDASAMSRPILEKKGFQILTYAHACSWRFPKA